MPEPDVVGDGAGEHRGNCATYPTWLGRRKTSGSVTDSPFLRQRAGMRTIPASARSNDDLPGPDRADDKHQLSTLDGQVDIGRRPCRLRGPR
jgi:hypothetical protein